MPSPEFDLLRDVQRVLRLYEVAFGALFGSSEVRARLIEQMHLAASKAAAGILIGAVVLLATPAHAQHNHAQHHASYNSWVNKQDKGCCDNQDCGELSDDNERTTSAGTVEVRIEGEWCPVLSFHYLKKGNAPDWSTSHVCVQRQFADMPITGACARLLCYQPKPGI